MCQIAFNTSTLGFAKTDDFSRCVGPLSAKEIQQIDKMDTKELDHASYKYLETIGDDFAIIDGNSEDEEIFIKLRINFLENKSELPTYSAQADEASGILDDKTIIRNNGKYSIIAGKHEDVIDEFVRQRHTGMVDLRRFVP